MIKSKTIVIFNIILGFMIIFYVIYIRFIVIRFPKELYIYDITNNLKLRIVFIIFAGPSIATYQIVANFRVIFNIHVSFRNSFFEPIIEKLNKILEDSLFETYAFILSKIPDAYEKLSVYSQRFYKTFGNFSEILCLIVEYIIRSVILISFLIDVFIFFRLEFMYKSLDLLLIPLCIKVVFYILKDIASNLDTLKQDLIIIDKGIDLETNLPRTSYKFRDINETADLQYHIEQYILCFKLSGYLEYYHKYRQFCDPYFSLILCLLYFVGWCFIIGVNIYTYFA